jgi:gas vesicle protein
MLIRREFRMENMMNHSQTNTKPSQAGKTVANIVIGTLVGAGAALLLAPKPGRQIRQDIARQVQILNDKTSKLSDTATKMARKQMDQAQKQIERVHIPDLRKVAPRKRENHTAKWVAGIAIGSALSAAAALLFAPKSGRAVRMRLRHEADELAGHAANLANETAKEANRRAKEMAVEAGQELNL